MSDSDRLLLTEIVEREQAGNAPRNKPAQYFEFFSAEQVLKKREFDLDPEEIRSGIYGGSDDGGVDSIFLFANGQLVREDQDLQEFEQQQLDIELVVVTTKYKPSFSEAAIEKLQSFAEQCLSLQANPASYRKLYNAGIYEAVERFRSLLRITITKRPTVTIRYFYASLGHDLHNKVELRARLLEDKTRELFSRATVECHFVGAPELLSLFYREPTKTIVLKTLKIMPSSAYGTAYVCLVPLARFYDFITDKGNIRNHIFESNIRGYQGEVAVNKEIAETLSDEGDEEFWWLNNGVTIIASKVTSAGDDVVITDPLIVNGLQTSYKIHAHFHGKERAEDGRSVMVRVIESTNPQSIDRIIKATNSQTKVDKIYLHATEAVHRKIELSLKGCDLYYDRRKNHYRLQGVAPSKIVTMHQLSQAVAAILLQRPQDARARPTTVANQNYSSIFSDKFPVKLYANCAKVMKLLDDFIDEVGLTPGEKNNLIFHTAMYAVAAAICSHKPKAATIAEMRVEDFTEELMEDCFNDVRTVYTRLGANDKVSKGNAFTAELKRNLEERFLMPLRVKRTAPAR